MSRPEAYVFIVTYGRSGSTVLQNLLNGIPGYLIRGENENTLMHLCQAWAALEYSISANAARDRGGPTGPHQPWYGIEHTDPDVFGRQVVDLFIDQVLRPAPDTRVCGFKEIRWHYAQPMLDHEDTPFFPIYLDFIRRFFPNARFIFNTRPIGNVLKSGWWKTRDPDEIRPQLEGARDAYIDYAAAHPEICLHMRYNAYRDDPTRLKQVFDFLGEPYDADLVHQVSTQWLTHAKPSGVVPGS